MRSARLVFFFVFILFGSALGIGYYFLSRPHVEADQLRSVATWGLADYLAKNYPNSKVLILANPFSTRKNMDEDVVKQEQAGIQGLLDGFADKMNSVEVVYPELIPDAYASPQSLIPDTSVTTPLSFLLAPDALAKLREEYPDHQLWVSLIGLPVGISDQAVWTTEGGARFALLLPDLRVIGGVADVKKAMHAKKLVAFVATQQGQMFDTKSISQDFRAEFDKHYLLVSPENIDQIVAKFPELFRMY